MLPAILVTLATFLVELSNSSPVYNMQPAFITTNIGTTGRNIRNLPCISRKNSQSGVCMFAIDCLKANGTHLGTCIDRFYFGSCCHIEPLHDIIENTIDTDLIPSREPPHRISSTTTSTLLSSTRKPDITNDSTVNILNKLGDQNITTTTDSSTTTNSERTEISSTTTKLVETNPTTFTPKPIETSSPTRVPIETTTEAQKLQTFQSVDGSTTLETTTKIVRTTRPPTKAPTKTTTKLTTVKPATQNPTKTKPVSSKPNTSTRPTNKPKPSRPNSTTSKPIKTAKPTNKPTLKPPAKPLSRPTKIPLTTKKTTTKTPPTTVKITKKPSTTPRPTKKATSTTKITTFSPTTTPSPTTVTPEVTTQTIILTTTPSRPLTVVTTLTTESPPISSSVSNELPVSKLNITSILETVNGNPATNEIEAAKPSTATTPNTTTKPTLVTWTVADNKNTSSPSNETNTESTTEDWVPITTPDGWVLLPSVPPSTGSEEPSSQSPPTSLPPPNSSTTEQPLSLPSTVAATTTTTKPFTTYIPLQATTTTSSITVPTETPVNVITNTTTINSTSETSPTTSLPEIKPANMTDFTNVCGRRMFPEARIVGGEKSSFGKWPWQISLRQWRTSTYLHKCGAALLNENWAITAAHCVDNVPPSDLLLRLGEHDLSTESEPYLHQERRVQIVASHPQFDPRTFEYDLALLRFYEPVTFQPNILPVCVPQTDENFIGRTAYVTGWGRLYEDGPLPSVLQEVSVPVINNSVCESMYRSAGYIEHIPHIFICAGWRRGGFDSCEGDSGGPMVIQRDDKRFLLAGVISWGIGCAEPNQPGVYTRISEFRDWINQILQF